ncbi:MAG: hypothetical protein KKA54_16150 [Proteobacteria bacterium]|nr:hypothetical protein [Pseudomonadota bacterium]
MLFLHLDYSRTGGASLVEIVPQPDKIKQVRYVKPVGGDINPVGASMYLADIIPTRAVFAYLL